MTFWAVFVGLGWLGLGWQVGRAVLGWLGCVGLVWACWAVGAVALSPTPPPTIWFAGLGMASWAIGLGWVCWAR